MGANARKNVAQELPEIEKWMSWSQQTPSEVVLPSGGTKLCDRGAEQGEPTASAAMGCTIGVAASRAHVSCNPLVPMQQDTGHCPEQQLPGTRASLRGGGVCDQWYMDDGQVFTKPEKAEEFLKALDVELDKIGAFRETGADRKSVARLLAPEHTVDTRALVLGA